VRKNFTESFCALFPKSLGATKIEDFDFTAIKDHLVKSKEEKNARPADEKKKETQERAE